jgi:Ni,Fe-hydrogenase III large subunit
MSGLAVQPVDAGALIAQVQALLDAGGRLQMAYAWSPAPGRLELRYVATDGAGGFTLWSLPTQGAAPSLAVLCPLMSWYEREIADLYGVRFTGSPDETPLIKGAAVGSHATGPETDSPDIQRLPFGPVRADVVESVELLFFYVGEHILHLHPQLFFKHRAMETRFEGRSPQHGAILAERVSGVGSFCHALAYCQAVEQATGCTVPPRAQTLRVALAELERIYNHLHYLGHLADTTTLKVGQAEGRLLEEQAKQINGRLTGSRFLRSLTTPGGLRRDLSPDSEFLAHLDELRRRTVTYTAMLEADSSYLDRLLTTGLLDRQVAFDQGATGPVQRASGLDRDLRRDHPYAAYDRLAVKPAVRTAGDAHARAQVRVEELEASFELVHRAVEALRDGPIYEPCRLQGATEGLGWAEGPRGSLYYAVHFDDQARLARVKIKSPSFSNWRAFPFTVHETNMMDYAINEASFGMTVAGCDR